MRITSIILILALAGCKSGTTETTAAQSTSKAADASKDKSNSDSNSANNQTSNDDSLSAPSAVTGALLTCATILPPVSGVSGAQVGCRLSDSSGKRVDPAAAGTSAVYAPASVPSNITVTQKNPQVAERAFDSIFELNSSDATALASALATMVYKVDLSDKADNSALGSKSSADSTVKIQVPRGQWVRKLESNAPYFVDTTTGLTWGVDDGQSYNFADATTHCASIDYAGAHNWRVPSITELLVANLDEINTVYPGASDMNIDNTRFGGYMSTALTPSTFSTIFGAGDKQLSMDFSKSSFLGIGFNDPSAKKSLICVHD